MLKFALREPVSGASSPVCTEICFAGACFRSKLPRVYWLGYLPGSMFRERVSGASFFVCTGWSTYPGACFGSVFQEQAPSCVPAFKVLANEETLFTVTDTLLLMMFLGLRKLGNISCGHKMFLNKIRNIFCVPDTKFVSATNAAGAGKRGNICVDNNVSRNNVSSFARAFSLLATLLTHLLYLLNKLIKTATSSAWTLLEDGTSLV